MTVVESHILESAFFFCLHFHCEIFLWITSAPRIARYAHKISTRRKWKPEYLSNTSVVAKAKWYKNQHGTIEVQLRSDCFYWKAGEQGQEIRMVFLQVLLITLCLVATSLASCFPEHPQKQFCKAAFGKFSRQRFFLHTLQPLFFFTVASMP